MILSKVICKALLWVAFFQSALLWGGQINWRHHELSVAANVQFAPNEPFHRGWLHLFDDGSPRGRGRKVFFDGYQMDSEKAWIELPGLASRIAHYLNRLSLAELTDSRGTRRAVLSSLDLQLSRWHGFLGIGFSTSSPVECYSVRKAIGKYEIIGGPDTWTGLRREIVRLDMHTEVSNQRGRRNLPWILRWLPSVWSRCAGKIAH